MIDETKATFIRRQFISPVLLEVGDDDEHSLHLSEVETPANEVNRTAKRIRTKTTEEETIAKRETRQVLLLKCLVIATLVMAAVVLSVSALLITRNSEDENFRRQYDTCAHKVLSVVEEAGSLRLWTAISIAAAYTSDTLRTPEKWPNVTLLDFEQRLLSISYIAQADSIVFAPFVTNNTRQGWEAYAREHVTWLRDSLATAPVKMNGTASFINETFEDNFCVGPETPGIECRRVSEGIWTSDIGYKFMTPETAHGEGPFLPAWQIAPFDGGHQSFRNSRHIMRDILGIPIMNKPALAVWDSHEPEFSQMFVDNETGPEPCCILLQPVFDSFDRETRTIVGLIILKLEMRKFFHSALSPSAIGLVVVIRNTCGQAYTYHIDGAEPTFVGPSDYHDPKYDNNVKITSFPLMDESSYWTSSSESTFVHNQSDWNEEGHEAQRHCAYRFLVYPSETFEAEFKTTNPSVSACVVACIFVFTIAAFLVYDFLVEKRQSVVLKVATRSNAIINALYPSMFRERVFQDSETGKNRVLRRMWTLDDAVRMVCIPHREESNHTLAQSAPKTNLKPLVRSNPKLRLKSFLSGDPISADTLVEDDSEPIAELFTDTTIMFGDIAGFTAWSSEREPTQVFLLLETIYRAFDTVAHRLGVFKVETIGDCYVAVTGLPDPNENHVVAMTWFAYECIRQMKDLVKELEVTLGPGTSDLSLRVGLHSGPVTAGVLRGEKARFQLFGDTMNTAARMESTGVANLIHASYETAQLLLLAGKVGWVTPRDGVIYAKGKGEMQTFWLKPRRESSRQGSNLLENVSCSSCTIDSRPKHTLPFVTSPALTYKSISSASISNAHVDSKRWGNLSLDDALISRTVVSTQKCASQKRERLVDWNVEMLLSFLVTVVSYRQKHSEGSNKRRRQKCTIADTCNVSHGTISILEEVTEIIELPDFDEEHPSNRADATLSPIIRSQLHEFVTRIASTYREHPFHNLEHASHVTMSAVKLMKRIINPDDVDIPSGDGKSRDRRSLGEGVKNSSSGSSTLQKALYDSTFGISYDPLTQFCVVFSALIHDVDHLGVPNAQLVKEQNNIALKFGAKSAAEQNSVHVAWEMLMEPRYNDLRACIYTTDKERKRFRQLVINAVMATDILDKELQNVRKNRWDKAFKEKVNPELGTSYDRNRKATSVIEHIIQASDVAHTMQHWHIFRKWNERLFEEMYLAFKQGRTESDPSVGWYEGQIGFFDHYIIPLAQKLKDCGVFGVAGDEYLSYALENRREWALKGREESEIMLVHFDLRCGFGTEVNGPLDEEDKQGIENDEVNCRREEEGELVNVDKVFALDAVLSNNGIYSQVQV